MSRILLISSDDSRGGISVVTTRIAAIIEPTCEFYWLKIPANKTLSKLVISLLEIIGLIFKRFDSIWLMHINYAPLARLFRKSRTVLATHGVEIESAKVPGFGNIDFVLTNTNSTKKKLEHLISNDSVYQVFYPGQFDEDTDLISKQFESIEILFVARIREGEHYKGLEVLLEGFKTILNGKKIRLHIVGDHFSTKSTMNSDHIVFYDYVDNEKLKYLYTQCNLFVMPSSREGQGLVYFEALQFGLPVIALEAGPAKEFIVNGVNGFLLESATTQSLQTAILKIVSNVTLHRRMSENAFESFQKLEVNRRFREQIYRILDQCAE